MKKNFLFFGLFIFLAALFIFSQHFQKTVLACDYDGSCPQPPWDCSNLAGSFEGSDEGGCDDNFPDQCSASGSCCAEIAWFPGTGYFTFCFLREDQPTPPPVPTETPYPTPTPRPTVPSSDTAPCPSSEMWCTELDNRYPEGCEAPCIRVVTQQGGPGLQAMCQCQEPEHPAGSVPCGESCQRAEDCADPCHYCWGQLYQERVCQETEWEGPGGGGGAGDIFCDDGESIDTALGCIPIDVRGFGIWLTSRAIIMAGGIAFLLMAYAGFQIITSSGDPKKLQAGQQLLTAAISGLLLIIFSIFLLRLIGITILGIPGIE